MTERNTETSQFLKNVIYVVNKSSKNSMPRFTSINKTDAGVIIEWQTDKEFVILVLNHKGDVYYSSNDTYSQEGCSIEQATYDISIILGYKF